MNNVTTSAPVSGLTPLTPSARGEANRGVREVNRLIGVGNDLVAASGIEAPGTFTRVRDGLAAAIREDKNHGTAALEALRVGLKEGQVEDIPALFSAAVAATTPADKVMASVFAGAARELLIPALHDVALAAHASAADTFNSLAAKFTEFTTLVDVELPAEAAMLLAEKARKAWLAAPDLVVELERVAGLLYLADLHAASEVGASTLPGWAFIGEQKMLEESEVALILTTDATEVTPEVVNAWKSRGRTGRWGAAAGLGLTLTARDHVTIWSTWQMPAWSTHHKEEN